MKQNMQNISGRTTLNQLIVCSLPREDDEAKSLHHLSRLKGLLLKTLPSLGLMSNFGMKIPKSHFHAQWQKVLTESECRGRIHQKQAQEIKFQTCH